MHTRRPIIASFISWVRAQVAGDRVRMLMRQTSAFYLAQIATLGLQFVSGLVVARQLGAADYGRYALAISVMVILRMAVSLGLPWMLTKQVASYVGTEDWGRLKGVLRFAGMVVAITGIIASALLAGAIVLFSAHPLPPLSRLLLIALPLLFILPSLECAAFVMKGLKKVGRSQFPDLLRSILFFAFLIPFVALGRHLNPHLVMLLRVAVDAAGVVFALYLVASLMPHQVRRARAVTARREWSIGLVSFLAIDAMYLIYQQTDVLMLGAMRPMAEVGVYRVAANLTFVVGFASMSASTVMAPHVASAWAAGRRKDIRDISSQMSRISTGLTLLVYFGILAGSPLIVYILGPDYSGLIVPLAILGIGHIARAATSSSLNLLTMTGAARIVGWGTALSAGLNLVLNAALIPLFGMTGAAIATTSCQILLAIFIGVRGYQRTGIDASILARHAAEPPQDTPSEEAPG